ncbi:MAG: hypothetical protein K2W82_10690 [Candidatus Obscuribacterales bacterium]|nr:hypothetical protein [Candidatus Obscuribacterales bacterium]
MFAKKQAVISLLVCATVCGCYDNPKLRSQDNPLKSQTHTPLSGLRLNSESTPYFWRQNVNGEEHAAYRDGRFGEFIIENERLLNIRFYNTMDTEKRYLVYEATYDEAGLRIKQSAYFHANGNKDTSFMRYSDDSELTSFFNAEGKLIKSVRIETDGSQVSQTYAADGVTISKTERISAEVREQILTYYADGSCRIKLKLQGVRIASWQYFSKEGKLDHTASFEKNGAIKFMCYKPEDGSLLRSQVWEVTGEDWNRLYYSLAKAEVFQEKKPELVQHRATFYRNGRAKQHFRYSLKGDLEAIRNFDITQQELCMEEFNENGESKGVFNYPVIRRGFIPLGLRGDPGSEDENNPAYNFSDGIPFATPRDALSVNPLFVLPKKN